MPDLERELRLALRWYPQRWRRRHEAALLGILLDQARAEGRDRMSTADRIDLARRGLHHRLRTGVIVLLLAAAALAVWMVAALLVGGLALDERLLFAPMLQPVPIGSSGVPLVTVDLVGWALYVVGAAVIAGSALGAVLLVRRGRAAA